MRIVADESVDGQIISGLRAAGHEVLYVAESDPGIEDEEVLFQSQQRSAVLLTADKDFGELVFRQRLLHRGVLLIRLSGLEPGAKADLVVSALNRYGEQLHDGFSVLTERALRIRRPSEAG